MKQWEVGSSEQGVFKSKINFEKAQKYTDEVCLCLGVDDVTPGIYGVEQPKEVRKCKPFVYSGKPLLSMT